MKVLEEVSEFPYTAEELQCIQDTEKARQLERSYPKKIFKILGNDPLSGEPLYNSIWNLQNRIMES